MTSVVAVDLHRLHLPLRHDHRAAHGTESVRDLIVVAVHLADGTVGWGECSTLARPTYTSEYTEAAWNILRDELVPALLAGRATEVVGHPIAKAGLLTAATDALLCAAERPLGVELAATMGANPNPTVGVTAVVGRADRVDDVVAAVSERVDQRVALVKLKVTPERNDLAAVGAVRAAWPDLALAVDFNGTADREALRQVDAVGLAYVEQPAPADALVTSAHFATLIDAPLALDESIVTVADLDVAVALAAGAIVNVKPARCGGPHAAAALVAKAINAGWGVFVGGMLESGVGRAAAVAVAALPGCTLPTDLGPSHAYFDVDITEALVVDGAGRLIVPTGPGIGRRPDPEMLERFLVERASLG